MQQLKSKPTKEISPTRRFESQRRHYRKYISIRNYVGQSSKYEVYNFRECVSSQCSWAVVKDGKHSTEGKANGQGNGTDFYTTEETNVRSHVRDHLKPKLVET